MVDFDQNYAGESYMKNFGETVQTARNEHRCDKCGQMIYPGEEYHRRVWKVAPRKVQIMREHTECPPDEFSMDFEREAQQPELASMSLAA
jgi:ferredoxin